MDAEGALGRKGFHASLAPCTGTSGNSCNSTKMQKSRKRAMHPQNKYAENAPDFSVLARKYPSFGEFVTYGPNKKPRIDWTDFNATRELTRVLLEQDYGIRWWIPDGQLCPTVPNRANYIHWIADLLAFSPAPWHTDPGSVIMGFDIGTGTNCIYPLLGAATYGWHFVGTDVTPVAIEWARRNLEDNPHLVEQIEIRKVEVKCPNAEALAWSNEMSTQGCNSHPSSNHNGHIKIGDDDDTGEVVAPETNESVAVDEKGSSARPATELKADEVAPQHSSSALVNNREGHVAGEQEFVQSGDSSAGWTPESAPLLVGVVKEGEKYDFCMCNPPFFESMEESGLNPRTACGGTEREMVYPGGELAFITRIVQDSIQLRNRVQWYTSMVGRKVNIKILTSLLRSSGVTALRTTEFVQGRTSRWGIAWSFFAIQKQGASLTTSATDKSKVSYLLEGIPRTFSAWDVLQALVENLRSNGATVTVDSSSFSLKGTISADRRDTLTASSKHENDVSDNIVEGIAAYHGETILSFQATVLQQAPGNLLIKASTVKPAGPSRTFTVVFEQAEVALKKQFLKHGGKV